jgi:hypothetical protein
LVSSSGGEERVPKRSFEVTKQEKMMAKLDERFSKTPSVEDSDEPEMERLLEKGKEI